MVVSWEVFLFELGVTVVGGVLLAVAFFFFKERIFPIPDLTGQWEYWIKTEDTQYNPYKGMYLRYEAYLIVEGKKILGTAEKVYEKNSSEKRSYTGRHRTRATITGYIEKNYLKSDDRIFLHIEEDGHGRRSTNFLTLTPKNKQKLTGEFSSFVARQKGISIWKKI